MKVVEKKELENSRYFFKILDFELHNEIFNIEVVAELSPSSCSVKRIESLNAENDLSISPDDVEAYFIEKIRENIDQYIHENPIF